MVACHSCHIHGAWRSKEVGGRKFKVIIWDVKEQRGRPFYGELTPLDDPSIPFLHSFQQFYKHIRNWQTGEKNVNCLISIKHW